MAAIVGIDAKVEWSLTDSAYTAFTERNEFSITINVDIAEHRVFVASLSDAWVGKARTWMNWNGSLTGYYDDANDDIFDKVVAGVSLYIQFYDSFDRTPAKYWKGQVLLTSVDHSTGTEDYATLTVDFEGLGALTRVTS